MRKKITTLSCEDGSLLEMEVHVDPDGVTCHPVKAEYTLQLGSQGYEGPSNLNQEIVDVFKDRIKDLERDRDVKTARIAYLEQQNETLQSQLQVIFDRLLEKVQSG